MTNLLKSMPQVIIFVDNSGADVILGILPFARELLRLGAQVWFAILYFFKLRRTTRDLILVGISFWFLGIAVTYKAGSLARAVASATIK